MLREAVAQAAADPSLRGALPLGIDLTDAATVRTLLADVVHDLARFSATDDEAGTTQAQAVSGRLARRVRAGAEPIAPLATTAAAAALHEATTVSLRRGLDARLRPGRDGADVTLLLPGKNVTLPAEATDALTQILTGHTVQAGDLAGLDPASSLVVARRLVREGVLVVR